MTSLEPYVILWGPNVAVMAVGVLSSISRFSSRDQASELLVTRAGSMHTPNCGIHLQVPV